MTNRFFEGRWFFKLLFEWKLKNAMDGSVLHVAASTEEVLDVLSPLSKD